MLKPLSLAGFILGAALLVLQLSLTVPLRLSQGDGLAGAVIFYFSFFTILTNLGVTLTYLSEIVGSPLLAWFRKTGTRTMFAALITLVMAVYALVLAATWKPEGWFKVADIGLHYVTPLLYLLWWMLLKPRNVLGYFKALKVMLLPPLIYVVYVMIRGALVDEYPYPFLQANSLGYGQVAINIAGLLLVIIVLFTVAIALNNLLARRQSG